MAKHEEISSRVQGEVGEFMAGLDGPHEERVGRARGTGDRFGGVNAPSSDQAHQPSPEACLLQPYLQDRAALVAKFGPRLDAAYAAAAADARELGESSDEWRQETNGQVEALERDRDGRISVEATIHARELNALEGFINDQIQAPFNAVKNRLSLLQQDLSRTRPNIWLKSTRWYFALLALIGLCEAPLNAVVFEALGVDRLERYLMASMLVLAIPLAAHVVGLTLKRRHAQGNYLVNVAVAGGVTMLVVVLSYDMAQLRVDYVEGTTGLATSPALFMTLSVLLYVIGSLLSYGHHDESAEFEALWREYVTAETHYRAEKAAAENRRLALIEGHEVTCRGIADKCSSGIDTWRNRRSTVAESHRETVAYHNAMLAALKGAELYIHNQCLETIQTFRAYNIQARRHQEEPVCFRPDADVETYSSYFDHRETLELPGQLVAV